MVCCGGGGGGDFGFGRYGVLRYEGWFGVGVGCGVCLSVGYGVGVWCWGVVCGEL